MNGKKYQQQSRRIQFRDGFPLSSKDINDSLDSFLYDLFTILSTETAKDNDTFKLLINAINDIDASLINNRKDKSVDTTKHDHTPNWRKI